MGRRKKPLVVKDEHINDDSSNVYTSYAEIADNLLNTAESEIIGEYVGNREKVDIIYEGVFDNLINEYEHLRYE